MLYLLRKVPGCGEAGAAATLNTRFQIKKGGENFWQVFLHHSKPKVDKAYSVRVTLTGIKNTDLKYLHYNLQQ